MVIVQGSIGEPSRLLNNRIIFRPVSRCIVGDRAIDPGVKSLILTLGLEPYSNARRSNILRAFFSGREVPVNLLNVG